MSRFEGPRLLEKGQDREGFDCGIGSLDQWLAAHARTSDGLGSARTYVITDMEQGNRVIGYHALTTASVEHEDATDGVRKGMPRYPIPAVLLARLAVDRSVQGRGVGAALLSDAMRRAVSVSDEVGIRLMLVHAINEQATDFYLRFGFEMSPTDPMNLQLPMKVIRASLAASVTER